MEDDGKRRTVYHYTAVEKKRYRREDKYMEVGEVTLWFPMRFWTKHILPLNTKTEIFDSVTGELLEVYETEYDKKTMRPTRRTTKRGNDYRRLTYDYDNWGNVVYTEDYSKVHDRVNQSESWLYYHNTNSRPVSEASWKDAPYPRAQVVKDRRNLVVGKITANYAPQVEGGQTVKYLHTYHHYNPAGQLTGTARWDGNEWLQEEYVYHPEHGSLVRKMEPTGHETVYEYDEHGLPAAVIEKEVQDAAGGKKDLVTRMKHEYISGWKLWGKNPRGYVTEYEYDVLGRVTRITAPDDDDDPSWIPGGSLPAFRQNNPVTTIEYDDTDLFPWSPNLWGTGRSMILTPWDGWWRLSNTGVKAGGIYRRR